ncbi:hypothetical protein [Falsiroseomonas sp. CW058]|uniref:hypothetical protein n=1 Tax=Falsiroseomonas sp. CW058 TaxID=3388664 RepID=UPI003D318AE6
MKSGTFIVRALQGGAWAEREFRTKTAADFYFAGVRDRGHIDPDRPDLTALQLLHVARRGGAPVLLREMLRASGGTP